MTSARERLMDHALEALVEDELTPEAVAARAQASKALVFYHFRTVEGLASAVEDALLDLMREGLDHLRREYPHPRRRLEALVDAIVSEPRDVTREGAARLLAFWTPRNRKRVELVRSFVEDALREGARTGETRRARDPSRIADPLIAAWLGSFALWAGGDAVNYEAVKRALKRDRLAVIEKKRRGKRPQGRPQGAQ